MVNELILLSKKLYNILEGNIKRLLRIKPSYYQTRYDICMKCKDVDYVFGFGSYCKHCGCPIKSKTRSKSEKCLMGKW